MRYRFPSYLLVFLPLLQACMWQVGQEASLTPEQALGQVLFFDTGLSSPPGQACASCHSPQHGFAEPDRQYPVSQGVHPERFGNRNAPGIAYSAFSPAFYFDDTEGLYLGGQFVDGRVASINEQAIHPFTNPLEMNNRDMSEVVTKVRQADYAAQFDAVYGAGALADGGRAGILIARAIAAFEGSREVAAFSSKYDHYLAGEVELSQQELRGLKLFEAEDKGNCAACHPSRPGADGTPPLFTDFSYDNLGVPRRVDHPFYEQPAAFNPAGAAYVDKGLGAAIDAQTEDGKFKVPSLRNVALTGPYMHNGVFEDLETVVAFYNSRDLDPKWERPEVEENVNRDELGDLKLTDQEVLDVVAFMRTLSDGFRSPAAR